MRKFSNVLLIDDDDISNFLTEIIIKDMNLSDDIHISSNGEEALNFIEKSNILTSPKDVLLLLDVNMPIMDGFELLDKLIPMGNIENFSIIMLTSSNYKNDIEKAKKYNVAGYINKPLTEEKLKEILVSL
jgi:CheY-like chemotaxis protein